MGVINIIIKDLQKKTYEPMLFLRPEIERLITENVISIIRTGKQLQICDIATDFDFQPLEKEGWKPDQGLYEKAILEYNQQHQPLLQRWLRHT
jgi:hypothetical protein